MSSEKDQKILHPEDQINVKDSATFSSNPEDTVNVENTKTSTYTSTFEIRTAQLLQGKRYSTVLVYDGAGFTYSRIGVRGTKVYMRCIKNGCKGRCNTELPLVGGSLLKATQPHSHPADTTFLDLCEARQRMNDRAASETTPLTTIFEEECARLPEEVADIIEYSKVMQEMHSRRKPALKGEHSEKEDDNGDSGGEDNNNCLSNPLSRKRKAHEATLKNTKSRDDGNESCPEEDEEDVDDPDNSTSVPEVRKAQIVQGKRLSTQVVYDGVGFSYIRNKEKGNILYLRCVKNKCKGRCKTELPLVDGSQLVATQRHNHGVDPLSPTVTEAKERMNERAATEITPMKTIFEEECARIPREIAKQLKFSKVIKTMYRRRKNSKKKINECSQTEDNLVTSTPSDEFCNISASTFLRSSSLNPIEQNLIGPNIIPLQNQEYDETSDNLCSSLVDFWICSNCGELFDQQSELEDHELIHPPLVLPDL